jgi:ATP-binding cassette subfamily B protein/ATP-binding cassette subfamily C protein LapB
MLVYDKIVGNDVHETLWALVIGMMLVLLLDFMLRLARAYVLEYSGTQWDQSLDQRITGGVMAHPPDRLLSTGAFFSSLREITARREVLSGASLWPLVDIPFLAVFLLFTWAIGGPLVFVPLLIGAAVVLLQFALNAVAEVYSRRAMQCQKEKIDLWHELLVSRVAIRGSGRSARARQALSQKSTAAAKSGSRLQFWLSMLAAIAPAVSTLTTVLVLAWGVYLVEAQAMSMGQLIATSILASRTVGSFMSIQPLWLRYVELKRAFRDMSALIDLDAQAPVEAAHTQLGAPPLVQLHNLRYAYPSAELPTLADIQFSVEPGQFVAVVGKVGCGKSSLMKLLAGHYAPTEGVLSVGGFMVKSASQAEQLGWQVAYLDQVPVLFGETVEDYLFGEQLQAQDRSIAVERMRQLDLDDILINCSMGMNTPILFAGTNLSGGQRRVLAFLRSICMGRHFIVLDEPTSGLDSEVEKLVLKVLARLKSTVTLVVASHSADIVAMADRILVLDKGRQIGWGAPRNSPTSPTSPTSPSSALLPA